MTGISPAILAASLAATSAVAFAAGFVLGTPSSHAEARNRPIVDPNAWNVAAPARLPDPPRTEIADCSPWDVSDTAMEAVLEEMQERGWHPPREVEEILADEQLMRAWREDAMQVSATVSGESSAQIEVVSDKEAARLWNAAPEAITPAAQPASISSSN